MVKINKIYTKTGDSGMTTLFGGERVPKTSLRVKAYGMLDELNSAIGLARCCTNIDCLQDLDKKLEKIQQELFDLGSNLASSSQTKYPVFKPTKNHVSQLEKWIDEAVKELPPLKSFVLPGGGEASARLHLARTICRRAEIAIIELDEQSKLPEFVIPYVNRLSDLLFAFARLCAIRTGTSEVLWKPSTKIGHP